MYPTYQIIVFCEDTEHGLRRKARVRDTEHGLA